MSYPTWTTQAGALNTLLPSQVLQVGAIPDTSIHLVAANTSTYKIVSGRLPPGLFLDVASTYAYIHGIVLDPGITKIYEFVVRAVNNNGVDDRTFSITVVSNDQPTLRTPAGLLPVGFNNEEYVLNKSPVDFQFQATVSALAPGRSSLFFYIPEGGGTLPPGLSLSSSGKLTGIIDDQLDIFGNSITGTYDKDPFDLQPYDLGNASSPATATSNINGAGEIASINLSSGGYGYSLDPIVIIGGSVASITILSGGQNYLDQPDVIFSAPPVSGGITAAGTAIVSSGSVSRIIITNPGVGYIDPPTIIIKSTATGAGATAYAVLFPGVGASALAHVSGSSVQAIDIISKGSGYTTAPKIIFGNPTIGPKIIGKTYRFEVAVTNGLLTDIKTYSIAVDSANVLRSDSTFIQSDTVIYQADVTYFQAPIWVTPAILNEVRGNSQVDIPLTVIDTTPDQGNIKYSVISTNLDLTTSEFGPIDNQTGAAYLNLDYDGGFIYGLVPYQPSISKTYTFTIKAARVVDDVEEIAALRQFTLTVLGNINSEITWTYPLTSSVNLLTPSSVGVLKPNEQSLLKVSAVTSLKNSTVNYALTSGFGLDINNYVSGLTISDTKDKIFVSGVGYPSTWQLIKGITYNIKINTTNFNVSIRQLNGTYYNTGLVHSDGSTGINAQEKTNGFWVFHIPFTAPAGLTLYYTNANKSGLIVKLKKYDGTNELWIDQQLINFKDDSSASVYYQKDISAGKNPIAVILLPGTLSWTVKQYNNGWQDLPIANITEPASPTDGTLWLDLATTSFGVYEEQVLGSGFGWVSQTVTYRPSIPDNSYGTTYQYICTRSAASIFIYRKEPGIGWQQVVVKEFRLRTLSDPSIFITDYKATQPVSLNTHDIWFKYNERMNGKDMSLTIRFKTNGSLPTDLTLSSSGNIIGKVSGILSYVYRSFYVTNRLYDINDVIKYNESLYLVVDSFRATGSLTADLQYLQPFTFARSINTSFDTHTQGVNVSKFDGLSTTFDRLLRFRVRAYDSMNVTSIVRDFYIDYQSNSNVILTNIYMQPFLTSSSRTLYRNFISDNNIFDSNSLYRLDDPAFGVQSLPRMLLLPGIQSTTADRYAGAVFNNFYNKKLVFSNLNVGIAKDSNLNPLYEIIYVEITDLAEITTNGVTTSVTSKIKLSHAYNNNITVDYNKIRVDVNDIETNQSYLDTIYPSSVINMQNNLKKVQLTRTDGLVGSATYQDLQGASYTGPIQLDTVLSYEDWGGILELVTTTEDWMIVLETLIQDDTYRPLWMNTSQDSSGIPIGYVQAVPICYCAPGKSAAILEKIKASGFDFKNLDFEIDRIIIDQVEGDTGAKYIKFANKDIV
jgi:hypothetical protein